MSDDGFLEHQQAAREGFVDPVGMGRDRIDRFIRGFREALVEIIGLIADRSDRLLRGRVEILGERSRVIGENRDGSARGLRQMFAHLFGMPVERAKRFVKRGGKPLMQGISVIRIGCFRSAARPLPTAR